jgi:hypothetical protein
MGLIMSGLITMGVAAAVFYAASGNTTTIQIENVSTTGSVAIEALVDRHWNGSSGGCPIDANGDGVSDHLGMSGPPGEAYALTLVDGATGKLLHEGKTYPQSSSAYCLDDRWFVVAQDNVQLDFYDARQPAAPISVAARDKLAKYAMGGSRGGWSATLLSGMAPRVCRTTPLPGHPTHRPRLCQHQARGWDRPWSPQPRLLHGDLHLRSPPPTFHLPQDGTQDPGGFADYGRGHLHLDPPPRSRYRVPYGP